MDAAPVQAVVHVVHAFHMRLRRVHARSTAVAALVLAVEECVRVCPEFDTFEGRQYDQETGRKLFAGPPRCEPAVRVQLCAGRMRDGLGNLWG